MNPFDTEEDDKVQQYSLNNASGPGSVDEDSDPLDAFMEDLKEEDSLPKANLYGEAFDLDEEETPEEMMDRIKGKQGKSGDGLDLLNGGHEGPKRSIENFELFDHSTVEYMPFKRDLYTEHESISVLPEDDISHLRASLGVSGTGSMIPRCVCSFAHFSLPPTVLSVVRTMNYSVPTPIQSQTIPCALSGRDVLAVAPTGSGKTMAYLLPAVVHVLSNSDIASMALILCPTRELAIQIEQEIYKFSRKCAFTSLALTGGLSKYEQFKTLQDPLLRFVVGNPGRVLDLLQMKKGLSLSAVTFCVLDEADRMFHMGFEPQVRHIVQGVRPDRQMLMFSATMPPRIERMARESLNNPIRIIIGTVGQAAIEIDQKVFVAHSEEEKLLWLSTNVPKRLMNHNPNNPSVTSPGRILIFVNSKNSAENLGKHLLGAGVIHGDIDQANRMRVLNEFKAGTSPILVATDVAARGLDIANVTCVVEFEAAKDVDTHTHRIGRTGRAGTTGTSWTLLGNHENKLAAHIAESIEISGRQIPQDLLNLANTYAPFREARIEQAPKRTKTEEIWEPLQTHFVQGETQLGDDEIANQVPFVTDPNHTLAPGVSSAFGKLSKIHQNT